MKILAVNGSPNRTGSTAKVIDMILEVCRSAGAECEKVDIDDYEIRYCMGCCKCIKSGECFQDDDFMQLKAKMMDADGIIIGSPYYCKKPSAQTKVFMDRLYLASVCYSQFSGKYFLGVATSSVDNCKNVAEFCASPGRIDFMNNGLISGLIYESAMAKDGLKDIANDRVIKERINSAGSKLMNDIQKKWIPLSYKLKRLVFKKCINRSVVRFLRKKDRLVMKIRQYYKYK